jgi:hypothetical protein
MIETLIEAVAGAWRETVQGEIRQHPSWFDLALDDREAAFEIALVQRALEAALDDRGLSTTARAVLDRIEGR